MANQKLMSSRQYAKLCGTKCPRCKESGSEGMRADQVEIDGNVGWQNVTCNLCKFKWVDIWKMTGYKAS